MFISPKGFEECAGFLSAITATPPYEQAGKIFHGFPREHSDMRLTALGVHAYALHARAQRSKRLTFLHPLIV